MTTLFSMNTEELRALNRDELGHSVVWLEDIYDRYVYTLENMETSKEKLDNLIVELEEEIDYSLTVDATMLLKLTDGQELSESLAADIVDCQNKIEEVKYHIERIWDVLIP